MRAFRYRLGAALKGAEQMEQGRQVALGRALIGVGMAGVYTAEIAETKVNAVHALAQDHGYPLRCSLEPE